MKSRVYVETSVISYLTGRPSRDLVVAAHQQLTREWWESRASLFKLFISELVIQEASGGDAKAAKRRLDSLQDMPILAVNDAALLLADGLIGGGLIPVESAADALHVAITATNGIDYLLTWNYRHLANAALRQKMQNFIEQAGFDCPVICTPEELLED